MLLSNLTTRPVGMATSMMLARKGWNVTVLDKRQTATAFEEEKGACQ